MNAHEASLEADVRDLLVRILALQHVPAGKWHRTDVDAWDSLKHMEIVFALEDRYGVRFEESEFATLDSPAAIAAALERHRAA